MIYHNSREAYYRTPRGAGACLSSITLRLRVAPAPLSVQLRTWWNGEAQYLPMHPCAPEVYEITYTLPGHAGIFWYHFVVEQEGQTLFYGNAADGLGGEGATQLHEPPGYQITIYDPAYATPEWMREGIMYQIMVDRFHAAKPFAKRTPPPGGLLHEDWHEPPCLRIDPGGDNEANDFYGGDLAGIEQKLPYLQSLGVSVLYLNPIFRARSNHKYDTGDYKEIDPSFGGEKDFQSLCEAAKARGIRILLDGVFSHTGADSRYFNLHGHYDSVGAYQSQASPYARWYTFTHWPDAYDSWWGFETLPNVREMEKSYQDFIIHAEDSVIVHWLRAGASGWRLDVADELPMSFLRMLHRRVKSLSPDHAVLGEVWEDASRKEAYGELRSYCLGDTLDSAMNYPLRDALFAFLAGDMDAQTFARTISALEECYPRPFFYALMNLLGSHDKPRVISRLAGAGDMEPPRAKRTPMRLTQSQYALGRARYLAAWRFLAAMPGMPCIYYGDEAGAQGMSDPFCRGTYPWGREDADLIEAIRAANDVRRAHDALRTGDFRLYAPHAEVCVCARKIADGIDVFGQIRQSGLCLCALNRSDRPITFCLPADEYLPEPIEMTVPALSAEYRL